MSGPDSSASAPAPASVASVGSGPAPCWPWYAFCLAALGGTGFWALRVLSEYDTAGQRALVPVSTVWGMHACVALALIALAALAVPLARILGRRRLLTGLGVAVLGYAACGLAPETNRIFYDEHIYMQIGQTLAHTGRAEYASHANVEYGDFHMIDAWVNKQPNGHPYVLSWVYRLAGAGESVSHLSTRLITALTAAIIFFALTLAPFALPAAAPLAAAVCFMFTPLVLWWSRTVAVEPGSAATVAFAFFAACVHARLRDPVTGEGVPLGGLLLAASAAFAAYFRPESLLVYPAVATLLLASDRRFIEDRATWAALALSLALLAPNLLHLWSVRTEDWGATDGRRFDFAFIAENFSSNAGYFIQGKWFPVAGTALALAGLGWLLLAARGLAASLLVWFALSWGIFVLFYAGGYHYGASSRYAVVSAVPVALFMGVGAAAVFALVRRRPVLLATLAVLVGLNWICALRFVPTLGRESNEARADIAFVYEAAAKLPTGALVISTDPCVWNLAGKNAAQMSSIQERVRNDLINLCEQYPGGIYLHWDYWMNTTPRFAEIWRDLIVDAQGVVVARHDAEAVKFALFRLDTPHALQVFGGPGTPRRRPFDLDAVIAEIPSSTAAASPAATPAAPPAQPEPSP